MCALPSCRTEAKSSSTRLRSWPARRADGEPPSRPPPRFGKRSSRRGEVTDGGKQQQRSGEACPVCGQHALQLLYFPDVGATGARPYDEIFGFGDIRPDAPPGIGCAACGAEWQSLDDFREGRPREAPSDGETGEDPAE